MQAGWLLKPGLSLVLHVLEPISTACLQNTLHVESCPYSTVTANHLLELIREKESEGSYSITHYLEDLPALLSFWLLSNVLKPVTQFSNTPAQTRFGRTHIHPLNSAQQFLIPPCFSKKEHSLSSKPRYFGLQQHTRQSSTAVHGWSTAPPPLYHKPNSVRAGFPKILLLSCFWGPLQ